MYFALILLGLTICFEGVSQQKISVKDIYQNNVFKTERKGHLNWMKDSRYYSDLSDGKIMRYRVDNDQMDSVFFDESQFELAVESYTFSADEKWLLLLTESEPIYRRSYKGKYFVYNIATKKCTPLSKQSGQAYASFAPNGEMVAFTSDNNLYYVDLDQMEEHQVTTDGKFGEIINGSSDWVYEEELMVTKCYFWSPDNQKLAFYKFDESEVKSFTLQYWGDGVYPNNYTFKYPKAGEDNAKVSLHVYDLGKKKTSDITINQEDFYIPKVQWTQDANVLSVMTLNRWQNELKVLHCDVKNNTVQTVLSDISDTYLDVTFAHELIYLDDKEYFIYSTESSGYKHYSRYTIAGKKVNQITKGKWEATSLVGIDQSQETPKLYYMSNEGSSLENHLYRVDIRGKKKEQLTTEKGWHSVDMSPDFTAYFDSYSSSEKPLAIAMKRLDGSGEIKVLEQNQQLDSLASVYDFAKKEHLDLLAADKTPLNAFILKPNDFDASKKYPMLVYQYSGPGSQNIRNSWGASHFYWHQMLVQQGFIVVCVDTRGTGGRGAQFRSMTYQQLGKIEVEDLIAVAKQMGAESYIDEDNMGIWGWSYGGYTTALAMMRGNGIFKAGISVAPVTNWRFYDTIYTERYMRRPSDNPGYDENAPNKLASNLQGNYLLIHGTADDNVHFQNALSLEKALVEAGKPFDSFYYTDKAHALYGKSTRVHLFEKMTKYFTEHLK